jgi:hypothetical protein
LKKRGGGSREKGGGGNEIHAPCACDCCWWQSFVGFYINKEFEFEYNPLCLFIPVIKSGQTRKSPKEYTYMYSV